MIECRRYRIHLLRCPRGDGDFHVTVAPLEYLERGEFRRWARICERNFMILASRRPWCYVAVLSSYRDALSLAERLAQQLGEPAFYDGVKAQLHLVTPEEETPQAVRPSTT